MRPRLPHRFTALQAALWLCALLVFACVAFVLRPPPATAQPRAAFDHQTTGFGLTGRHEDVRCETCHIKGIFKGSPRDCAGCHIENNERGALAKPVRHIQTSQNCDACHTTSAFSALLFRHAAVDPGLACTSCHDNVRAKGKPANHVPTSLSCGQCHTTSAFVPVLRFDHQAALFGSWTCTSCHDGRTATGKPANHIPTLATSACETCHQASISGGYKSFAGGEMDHRGYASGCALCHAPAVANTFFGVRIVSSSTVPPHIPAPDTCELCHQAIPAQLIPATGAVSVGATTFANGQMSHQGITSNCALCHGPSVTSGTFIGVTPKTNSGLVPPHVPTSEPCELCHANAIPAMPIPAAGAAAGGGTTFANGQMSHRGITTNCAACHGPGVGDASFFGITAIVVMPPTSPVGASAHIPSSTSCESCHLGSTPAGLVPANAFRAAPGTAFAKPAPTSAQIHAGVSGGCNACHEAGYVWMGMSAYPIAPATLVVGAQYTGFQTRPRAAAGTYSVADAAHPGTGDCSQCHTGTTFFDSQIKPANHIPTAASAPCGACHVAADYRAIPSLANIHANAPSTTSNCAQCHGAAAASFAIPAANFFIVGMPNNHLPTSAPCELCHVGPGSSVPTLPVPNGARFSGSLMSHQGITNNCVACHGPNIGATSFAGVTNIVVMPPTSPVGASAHIPSSTSCESCHLGSTPAGLVPANASRSAPGTAFATPAPTGAQIHAGVSGGCNACHEAGYVWMGMSAYPIAPATLVVGAQYTGFQTRPRAAAGTFNVADAAHPSSGDCSQCHASTSFFSGVDRPANHIPYAASAQCTACHVGNDYRAIPSLVNIHANAPSTTSNCAQCHGAAAASFAIPSANFFIVGTPNNHLPTSAPCELCHVGPGSSVPTLPVPNGARFSGSLMSHQGITNNCAACHGPNIGATSFAGVTNIVVMPPTSPVGASSHIPSSTSCESCHLGSTPAGLVPANASRSAPGTAFATPAPTGAQIHAGVSGGCNACHEAGYVWMGMSAYPIAPATLVVGAQYTGFQTRPRAAAGTYSVADAAHPGTGDCSLCHTGTTFFDSQIKPANHIPTAASAPCGACHVAADYRAIPSLANIHANAPSTTSNCAQCHGAAAASFAIPAANFFIVGMPNNHLPTSAPCELCHVGPGSSVPTLPVPNGARFSGSLMSHQGITNNCVACHGPNIGATSFAGVTNIVVMPPTSPVGAGAHIPSSTSCESCHLGSTPAGLVPANASRSAPGTAFATPAPTGAQIHAGVSGGCNACHEAGYVWMGMSAYPIAPATLVVGAQYTGFQTRPRAAAGTFNVADAAHPSSGDCSQCHASTSFFSGVDRPANHIPYAASAQCTACHVGNDYRAIPSLVNIHANAPSTTSNCAQCHGAAAASFAIPAANFFIVGMPNNHLPTSAPCELCHVGPGSSVPTLPVPNGARFSGSLMSHQGITNNCVACHGPNIGATSFAGVTNIVVMPPTSPVGASAHIPSSTSCESCHLGSTPAGLVPANASRSAPGTAFATPAPTGAQIHAGVSGGCNACHEAGYVWMGMSAYPIAPATLVVGAQYTGFQTRPRAAAGTFNVADAAHPGTGDCSQCHTGTTFFDSQIKPANHIPTAASAPCGACHVAADYRAIPSLANIHANAPSTTSNCAQCHGAAAASFAIPAANFFIVGMPNNHLPTSAPCELCHVGPGSSVPTLPVPNGARFSGSLMSHQGITNNCVACHGPNIGATSFAGVTNIVVMPPTSPVGAGAHIPSSTSCESCHLGSTPAGLVPANASRSAPGTAFATPAPTGAQIHAGVSGGCNACHEAGYVWMGMSAYPIAPSTLVVGAQYTGFQTRPRAAAGTFNVADAAHPATGDCSQCHSGTTYFESVFKPPGHIPTTQPNCSTCHVTPGDFSIAGLTSDKTALHTGISNGCANCHRAGPGAGPFAGCATQATCATPPPLTYQPRTMPLASGGSPTAPSPQTHVPVGSAACEKCHAPSVFTSFAGMNMAANVPAHVAVATATCMSCHEYGYTWFGVTIKTPSSANHNGRAEGQDCISSGCHARQYFAFGRGIVRPVLRSAVTLSNPRLLPNALALNPAGAQAGSFNHQGVAPGQCRTCHNGQAAKGLPSKHWVTRVSCDSCHRTTAWTPAQFNHQGSLIGQCQVCHNGSSATGKASSHFSTARSCDACHRTFSWLPVTYSHLAPGYRPQVDKPTCVSCHITNGEIIPRQLRGGPRPRPIPVTPGA